ncbi:GNVR domain-containing protein [uncultured Cohaesibacter sp.]|uniref:GNVR domain-containing protein n=1 Tax=uncultured Cohaesibacter sp. TaxID=1002546 RepID=UPI0029C9007D|nr:GNVR domain-containing protein [uncultured Cohaesibacter sp.]
MFGRKKKKADLDWQPDVATKMALAGEEVERTFPASSDASRVSAEPIHNEVASTVAGERPYARATRPSEPYDTSSDVWTGLIHPRAIMRFMRKSLRTIITVALVIMLLGYAIYSILPAKFGTVALILVDPRQPRVTNSDTVISGIGGDAAALTSYVEIMNSDGFLSKVVDELGVKNDPDFAKAKNKGELIAMFRSSLSANRQGATYIVQVYYSSKNPESAAKYANGVANAFVRDQRDYRVSTNEEATQWLHERLKLLQSNLKTSEDAVAAFQARNGIVNGGAQGTLDNQQLASLVTQLATASTEYAEARARYEQASKDGVPASADNTQSGQFTVLDQLLQEQARLRRQAAELGQTYGSRHPRMLAITEQQRIIAGQLSQERSRLVKRTKQAFETAQAKKNAIEQQLADARQRSIQLNKSMVELASLEREASANRNLYEQFLARYKITDEQSRFQYSEARIVSEAPVPQKSTKPSLKLVLPVLLILGLGLGLLYSLIREAFSNPQPQPDPYGGMDYRRQPDPYLQSNTHSPAGVAVPVSTAATTSHLYDEIEDEREGLGEDQIESDHQPVDEPLEDLSIRSSLEDEAESVANEPIAEEPVADEPLINEPAIDEPVAEEPIVADHSGEDDAPDMLPEAETSAEPDDTSDEVAVVAMGDNPSDRQEDDPVIPFRSIRSQQPSGGTIAPRARVTSPEPLTLVHSAGRDDLSRTTDADDPILITLPDDLDEEEIFDELIETRGDAIEHFIGKDLEEETVSLLVTSAQPGDGETLVADVMREFAIDAGFHPVIISVRDSAERVHKAIRSSGSTKTPERVARLQVYEDFDIIPFVTAKGISSEEGLASAVKGELRDLIALCRENYGFVILETRHILDPATLEDLINLVDCSLMVLKESELSGEDLDDWKLWAEETGVGLVLDQTQI